MDRTILHMLRVMTATSGSALADKREIVYRSNYYRVIAHDFAKQLAPEIVTEYDAAARELTERALEQGVSTKEFMVWTMEFV